MSEQQNTEEQVTTGAHLKRLRNEKNLSVAEVAARMYLPRSIIEALEEDDHDSLHSAYIYGYLLHYAKILDVPADELVALYKKDTGDAREQAVETQKPAVKMQKRVADTLTWPKTRPTLPKNWTHTAIYLVVFILVLASLALWRSRYAQEQVENTGTLDYPVTIVEHPDTPSYPSPSAEMEQYEQPTASAKTPEPETTREDETAQDPESTREPAAEPLAVQGESAETLTTEPETSQTYLERMITSGTGPDTVTLVLSVDCWIEVFDAEDNKVFYDLARAGQTLVLGGMAPFSVLLGNADAATVEFNNVPFDITPHVTGIGIARFVLGADQ